MRKTARIAYTALIVLLMLTLAVTSYAAFSKTVMVSGTATLRVSGATGASAPAPEMMIVVETPEPGNVVIPEPTLTPEPTDGNAAPTPGNTPEPTPGNTPEPTPGLTQEIPPIVEAPAQSFDPPELDGANQWETSRPPDAPIIKETGLPGFEGED